MAEAEARLLQPQQGGGSGNNSSDRLPVLLPPLHELTLLDPADPASGLGGMSANALAAAIAAAGGSASGLGDLNELLQLAGQQGGLGLVAGEAPSRHLWLGNLNTRLPRSVLRAVFENFGTVEDVVTFPGRM